MAPSTNKAVLPAPPRTDRFVTTDRIGDVLERCPSLGNVFLAFGFPPRANPLLRQAIAPYNTLEKACRLVHVDPHHLVRVLNAGREQEASRSLQSDTLSD
jgi:hypothetical protein